MFSGDTAPSQNLVRLAKGADILVQEVIVSPWIDRVLPPPRNPAQEALRTHLLSAHTPVEKVGKIAESAGVSTLVLNHIVPGNVRAEELVPAQEDDRWCSRERLGAARLSHRARWPRARAVAPKPPSRSSGAPGFREMAWVVDPRHLA